MCVLGEEQAQISYAYVDYLLILLRLFWYEEIPATESSIIEL